MMSKNEQLIPNIEAEILPGQGAAGFALGEHIFRVQQHLNAKEWNSDVDGQLVHKLSTNEGWLKYSYVINTDSDNSLKIVDYFFGKDTIRLHFRDGILALIAVGDGYLGRCKSIEIGTNLNVLSEMGKLSYDDVEEVYFGNDNEMHGVAFQLDVDGNVVGIIIHDQSIQYEA